MTRDRDDERPPIGGRWLTLYLVVIGFLALQVVAYWIFTRAWR